MQPETEPIKELSLEKPIRDFHRNIGALREFVQTVDDHLTNRREKLLKDKAEHLLPLALAAKKLDPKAFESMRITEELLEKQFGIKVEISEVKTDGQKKSAQLKITGGNEKEWELALEEMSKGSKSQALLYESMLISLLNSVELFFSNIIHYYFRKFPDALGNRDKVFSLEDLKGFDTVEDARAHLVESRVEALLREPFEKWIEFLKQPAGLSMGYLDGEWERLLEANQRRNLIVHNGCVVNSIYLSKVKPSADKQFKKGDRLGVSLG